ncbi:MAG: zf-HC2 domain-containing protein [Pseudonocardia sp.]
MTGARGQFRETSAWSQAWGQAHLALEAIVAFVDEELSPGARRRALSHLAGCGECASEVVAQTQARLALRTSAGPSLPSSLLHSLRTIPSRAELPAAPTGLAVSEDGQLVSVLRPAPARRRSGSVDRRVRLGAGALFTGMAGMAAFGALAVVGAEPAELLIERSAPTLDARLQVVAEPRQSRPAPVRVTEEPGHVVPTTRSAAYVPAVVFNH